ncbi:MAG TPA: helix-turn-helix transcriptional regulator [Actinophytocola sp.]|uniref:helix-turn-helix domain-containing protein n=1 Tax=Actinophytocola sp. TaxID=1872138 RepID=UPI002DBBEB04|nr:helix-turn-helix transcriptional regulator [Actinophytocola sp.]HEU5474535.1 helix-turn-helix transcriptional regulator [Actinophytocola sp.]
MRDQATVRSRELGEGLRLAMEKAGFSGRDAARRLGWSDSKVSRLLTGLRAGTEVDVSAFLAVCGVKGKERQRLLSLCREQHTPGWFQQHGSRLPRQVRTLVDHENKAVSIGDYQSTIVPGLLQTGHYARALMKASGAVPPDEIDDRIAARLARQNLLSRDRPPTFTFFLHEFVLHLPVGGPVVMSDQLHTLLRMSVRPNLTLRVLPAAIGAHAAVAGNFTLMEFAEFKPVVYLDSETSSLFLEEPEEISAYKRILASLSNIALGERESRDMIAGAATELYADRENHDHLAEEQLQR